MSIYKGTQLISGVATPIQGARNIGQIIQSTIPLTDAGLHLLDGSLINGSGIYSDFVDYIADLYYSSSGSSEIRTNPIMTSNTAPYGTASYTGTLYSTSQPFAMLAGHTSSTAWTTDSGSVTYTYNVAQQPLAGTYRFYFRYGSYDASGRSLGNVVITVTYEDNTTSTINVGNLTGTIHATDNHFVVSEFTTSKKIKSFTLSHSGSSVNITTMNIGNFQLQRMVPNYFCQEWQWQNSVTTYGVCGKFVYDSVNNTVRLPKITGFVEGASGVANLGDLTRAGLPNITASWTSYNASSSEYPPILNNTTGAVTNDSLIQDGGRSFMLTNSYYGYNNVSFNASRSNSIYGRSNTVQPQSIKVLYYIVMATSTKTDIEVDIDEIATDLNGKADVDLTNVNNTGTSRGASWAMPSTTYDDLTLGASGTDYMAPANGYFTLLMKSGRTDFSPYVRMWNIQNGFGFESRNGVGDVGNNISIAAKQGDIIRIDYDTTGIIQYFHFIYAVGSESEAS